MKTFLPHDPKCMACPTDAEALASLRKPGRVIQQPRHDTEALAVLRDLIAWYRQYERTWCDGYHGSHEFFDLREIVDQAREVTKPLAAEVLAGKMSLNEAIKEVRAKR